MERLTHERVNGIKTGYWSAATKEVLVQKLAAYENTGYEPDEIRAATNPVATALYVTSDGNGELVVAEMVPQVPGQMNIDGTQQEAPKLLKLVQHA